MLSRAAPVSPCWKSRSRTVSTPREPPLHSIPAALFLSLFLVLLVLVVAVATVVEDKTGPWEGQADTGDPTTGGQRLHLWTEISGLKESRRQRNRFVPVLAAEGSTPTWKLPPTSRGRTPTYQTKENCPRGLHSQSMLPSPNDFIFRRPPSVFSSARITTAHRHALRSSCFCRRARVCVVDVVVLRRFFPAVSTGVNFTEVASTPER